MRRKSMIREAAPYMVLATVWLYLLMQVANWVCDGKLW